MTLIEEKLQQQITQETHLVVINVVVCFVSVSVDGTYGEWTVAGCPRCCCLGAAREEAEAWEQEEMAGCDCHRPQGNGLE